MSGYTGRYSWASYSKPKPKPRIMWKKIMGLEGTTAKISKGKTVLKGNVSADFIRIRNFPGMTEAKAISAVRRLRYRKMKASLLFWDPRTGETWIAIS